MFGSPIEAGQLQALVQKSQQEHWEQTQLSNWMHFMLHSLTAAFSAYTPLIEYDYRKLNLYLRKGFSMVKIEFSLSLVQLLSPKTDFS